LRNPQIPEVGQFFRKAGFRVFDDWFAAGPRADDHWKEYEQARGRSYKQALNGAAARNVFQFDKANLDAADAVVLVLPAGKSAHLELGYCAGKGKRTCVLMPDTDERWDVMYRFADIVVNDPSAVVAWLENGR
jgi:nucleoside 2-deoxyribosyltransferase